MSTKLTIVMYHYVRNFQTSRYPKIKGLEYSGFLNQLDFLSRNYTIMRMEDVVDAHRSRAELPENAALLTFDDGYTEHYNLVFPALYDRRLQGSFFAPVEPVRDAKLLDVNRVHFILASCGDPALLGSYIDKQVNVRREQLDLDTVSAYRAKWAIANRFDNAESIYVKRMLQTALPETFRNEIAAALFAQFVSSDEAAFASELYITRDQAKLMQSSGMYFGSHGFSHYWLNHVPAETQMHEVDASLEFLRDIGSPVDDFWVMCYPFGGWNEGLLDVLRSRQCTLGLTTEVDTADLSAHPPLTLPRYDTNDFPR